MEPSLTFVPPVADLPTKKKKSKLGIILLHIIVVILISAGAAFLLYINNQSAQQTKTDSDRIKVLESQITDLTKKLSDATPVVETVVSPVAAEAVIPDDTATNIKNSITSKNTAALEGYMASSVNVVFAGTDEGGAKTATEAINSLSHIEGSSESTTWNFNSDNSTIANHTNSDYDTFFKQNSIIGRSSDGYLLVINFDSAGKINSILMDTLGLVG